MLFSKIILNAYNRALTVAHVMDLSLWILVHQFTIDSCVRGYHEYNAQSEATRVENFDCFLKYFNSTILVQNVHETREFLIINYDKL